MELVGLSIIGIIGIAIIALVWNAFWLWWQSVLSNAPVGLLQIIFMRFRKVRPALIVRVRITATMGSDRFGESAKGIPYALVRKGLVQPDKRSRANNISVKENGELAC